MSHDPLHSHGPGDVLEPAYVAEYERHREALWQNLVRLHNNISLVEDIATFPGWQVLGVHQAVFNWLARNTFEYSILIAWRLWDGDQQSVTLPRLRNSILRSIRAPYRDALRDRLRFAEPGREITDVLERATEIRNGQLAHLDRDYHFGEEERLGGVSLRDLRAVCAALERFYNALSIGDTSLFWVSAFERRTDERNVTQRTLEAVAMQSRWNTLYDKHGPDRWWRAFGSKLSSAEIHWLSDARQRHGLPPIEPREAEVGDYDDE